MIAYIDTSALLRIVLREPGTLDAIHLATALIWRDRMGSLPRLATHHGAATAARAFGFEVRGT